VITMRKSEYNPAETDCVVSAANYLEVSEFAIFQNAYMAWYGLKAPEKQLEKVFASYLVDNRVPFWVRNYARNQIPGENSPADSPREYSITANNLLYLATIVVEYVLLASYLVMR